MSRIYEAFAKTKGNATDQEPPVDKGLPSVRDGKTVFELPPLLIDETPEALAEFECLYKNLLMVGSQRLSSLAVCGVSENEVTANVTLNLGAAVARNENRKILFIETNTRRPIMHRFQKGRKCDGFCELLAEHRPLEHYAKPTSERMLYAIRAGGIRKKEQQEFHRAALEHLVESLESKFSLILFDAPPVGTQECMALATCVDGVVFVVPVGTPVEVVNQAKVSLDGTQARLLGVILNHY